MVAGGGSVCGDSGGVSTGGGFREGMLTSLYELASLLSSSENH